jgi:hypothetical protein
LREFVPPPHPQIQFKSIHLLSLTPNYTAKVNWGKEGKAWGGGQEKDPSARTDCWGQKVVERSKGREQLKESQSAGWEQLAIGESTYQGDEAVRKEGLRP